MKYSIQNKDGIEILALEDERLDTTVAPELKARLLAMIEKGKKVLLDLEKVQYADSSGLGAILLGYRQARDLGAKFAVCNVQGRVRALIDIAQLNDKITIFNDTDEALRTL